MGNAALTGLFCTESLVKGAALGREYLLNPWDLFDFIVTWASLPSESGCRSRGAGGWRQRCPLGSLCCAVLWGEACLRTHPHPTPPRPPAGPAGLWMRQHGVGMVALRAVRVVRLGRLVRHLAGLKRIASALFIQLPALGNAVLVVSVVLFMFATIGCQAFYGGCTPRLLACAAPGGRAGWPEGPALQPDAAAVAGHCAGVMPENPIGMTPFLNWNSVGNAMVRRGDDACFPTPDSAPAVASAARAAGAGLPSAQWDVDAPPPCLPRRCC